MANRFEYCFVVVSFAVMYVDAQICCACIKGTDMGSDLVNFKALKSADSCSRCCTNFRSEYSGGRLEANNLCESRGAEQETCTNDEILSSNEDVEVFFKTTMGPTVFTVARPATDKSTTIVPQYDDSASLVFAKEDVMTMMTSAGITVKETGVPHPKGATCTFPTAGPITGSPTCAVSFSLITMYCSCNNFPRSAANNSYVLL